MLDLNTSEQRRPTASERGTPVITSAALLKEVMRHFRSMVKTPSEMLSRIVSVRLWAGGVTDFLRFAAIITWI